MQLAPENITQCTEGFCWGLGISQVAVSVTSLVCAAEVLFNSSSWDLMSTYRFLPIL